LSRPRLGEPRAFRDRLARPRRPDPERAPPRPRLKYPEIQNFAETTAQARNEAMIPQIRAVIENARAKDLRAAGFFDRSTETAAMADKQGNLNYGRIADAYLSTTIRDSAGSSSGWAAQPAARIEEIDGGAIARSAIEKCLRWRNPKRLD